MIGEYKPIMNKKQWEKELLLSDLFGETGRWNTFTLLTFAQCLLVFHEEQG